MIMMSRILQITLNKILAFILLISFSGCGLDGQNKETEIFWDTFGVPHIFAKNNHEMYYAFGWAQMHNHADLILKLYAQGRGRAAEYWGIEFLNSDKLIHLYDIPAKAKKVYGENEPEYKSYLDAFVKGINDYANACPERIDKTAVQVLPVTVDDVIAHTLRITCLEFLAAEDVYIAKKTSDPGSNAIAIAPSKSASKNAMLLINPHLPWSDFFLWFEAHLCTNEFNAYGVSLIGIPTLTMAFNDNLGWAHTVNPIDASDRYELTLKNDGYLLDGKTIPFETKPVQINVRQNDGSLLAQKFEFKYSKHGPVIGQKDNKAYAVRIAGLDNVRIFEQYHKMAKAKNFAEFEEACKILQNPMFNVIYADRDGIIFYLFNGNIPVREEGDFYFWKGTIDGTKSKYIWQKTHPYEDLPKVLNPSSGFVQNCNDPPWTCTFPAVLDPKDFPAYFSSQGMPLRPQRAVNLIKDNPSISFEQLINYKHNTGMEAADRFLDDLLEAVDAYSDTTALKAAAILKAWDKTTDANSHGAVLFASWWDKVRSNMFAIPWNAKEPVTTPDGLKDKKQAVELLVKSFGEVQKKYGSSDVTWGDVHRFRLNGIDFPANGGAGDYGIFRTVYFADDKDNKKYAVAGETFIAITEFGDKVKAMLSLGYGNATQPGSKHIGDQLQMMSEKKLRPALLEKADIQKNLEEREVLVIEGF